MKKNEKEYFKEIKQIENKYFKITSHFKLTYIKPLNYNSEKRKFFQSIADDKIYNPQFKFKKRKFDKQKINELKQIKINTKNDLYGFKKIYKDKITSKILMIQAHQKWGKQEATKYVIRYRGKPSRLLLLKAKKICRNYKREKVKFKTLNPEIVSQRLSKEVKRLTGDEIKVIFVSIPSKVNINPSFNIIKINPNVRLTSLDVKRLKVHEIGVHYLRYFNAKKIKTPKVLTIGTSNYSETEEGLAVYAEYKKGVLSKAQMFIYAGRVISTYYALRKSFYETFQILKEYGFKDEDAYTLTYRAKRNICDTSQKGGFTKDYIYFSGYNKVKKYAKRNDLKNLFIGKISIKDSKKLKKYIKENHHKIKSIL